MSITTRYPYLMFSKPTWLHLRIPFSLFLMPVFCFAAASYSANILSWRIWLSFFIIHLFLYPASNGYNSYFDKDKESIGGLEKPPPVSRELYYVSLLFEAIALGSGLLISWQFSIMLLIFGLISKMYSHPAVRLKKYPLTSLFTVAIFQGGFAYFTVTSAITLRSIGDILSGNWFPALLSTLMLAGFYPMTQIYQHKEDSERGDLTFSLMLGIKGTFIFSGMMFLIADAGFYFLFPAKIFFLFQLFLFPIIIYFIRWSILSFRNIEQVNYRNTMRLNYIASVSLVFFFIIYGFLRS